MEGSRPRFVVPAQGGRGVAPVRPLRPPVADVSRFRAAFEQAPVGLALGPPAGTFHEANRHLRELLAGAGLDPDAVGPAELARHAPAPDAARWRRGLVAVGRGLVPSARADLPLGPPAAGRRMRATVSAVLVGDERLVLTQVEELVDTFRLPAADPPAGSGPS